ncbi:MAG: protein kinase [Polyangiaceae bacterium]|nr:protein kinase [Polyangiaceae bacterium]
MYGSLGRYQLVERLGEGGWGEVFKAKSFGVEGFEKIIIVKRVFAELAAHPEFVQAFLREAKRAVSLSHANIVQVFDLGRGDTERGDYYLAAEFVAGMDLESMLGRAEREGPLPVAVALYVTAELARALDHGHRRPEPIVHGDITPSNVRLSWDGEVKLADFAVGLAQLVFHLSSPELAPRIEGKLAYASPELLAGSPVTGRSDVYSLGVVLARMLDGAAAPPGSLRPDVPDALRALLARMLARDPAGRPDAARVYEEVLQLAYATGARMGDAELAEFLENLRESSPRPAFGGEALVDPGEEQDVEVWLDPGPPSSVPPPLQELASLSDSPELPCLVLSYRTSSSKDALLRGRATTSILSHGGRELGSGPGWAAFVFGLEPEDTHALGNAAAAALSALRAIGPLARPSAGLVAGRVHVSEGLVDDGPERDALIASARALAETASDAVLVSDACAAELRRSFMLVPAPGARAQTLGEPRPREPIGAFVGRRQELRWLSERLGEAGRSGVVALSLTGSHGIGKTRILLEAQRRARRAKLDLGIFIATCPPGGQSQPLSGVTAMLRALTGVRDGDSLDGVLSVQPRLRALGLLEDEAVALTSLLGVGPTGSDAVVRSAFAKAIGSLAAERLHVLAWDDAHELDPASAALLAAATERLQRGRLVLLFAGRSFTAAALTSLPSYAEFEIGALDEADAERLVRRRLGVDEVPRQLLAHVATRAQGHPMFIEELLRHALETRAVTVAERRVTKFSEARASQVPSSLKTLLATRLRNLPDAERGLLIAVAILSPPAELAVVAQMLELPLGTLQTISERLVERAILAWEGKSHVRFHSPLVRETLIEELAPEQRSELHERAANAWMVVLGPRTEELAHRIGHHLALAGQPDRAAGYFATSGFFHRDAHRLDIAASSFIRALQLADLSARGGRQLVEWIQALSQVMRHVRADSALPELVQRLGGHLVLDKSIDPRDRGQMVIDLALSLGAIHRYKEARRMLQRAADAAASWPDLALFALSAEAELAIRQGEMKLAEQALVRASELPAADALMHHRLMILTAQTRAGAGHTEAAEALLDEAEAQAPADDVVLQGERAKVRALIYGFRGDWQRCAEASERAADQMRKAGLLHEVAVNLHNQGDSLLRLNEHARAYAVLKASLDVAEEIGSERLVNLNALMLGYLDALRGGDAGREAMVRALTRAEAQKWTWDVVTGRYLLGRLHLDRGDRTNARRELALAKSLASSTNNRVLLRDCEAALALL